MGGHIRKGIVSVPDTIVDVLVWVSVVLGIQHITKAPNLTIFKLTDTDLNAIKKVAGVEKVTGVYFKVVEVKQDTILKYTFIVAYDPKDPLMMEVFDIGLEKGGLTATVTGVNYSGDSIAGDYYDSGSGQFIQKSTYKVIHLLLIHSP